MHPITNWDIVLVGLQVALGALGLILGIIWLFLPFYLMPRLRELTVEARRQTELLERIAAQTVPPRAPGAPGAASAAAESSAVRYNPLEEPKTGFGFVIAALVVVAAVGAGVYYVTHR